VFVWGEPEFVPLAASISFTRSDMTRFDAILHAPTAMSSAVFEKADALGASPPHVEGVEANETDSVSSSAPPEVQVATQTQAAAPVEGEGWLGFANRMDLPDLIQRLGQVDRYLLETYVLC